MSPPVPLDFFTTIVDINFAGATEIEAGSYAWQFAPRSTGNLSISMVVKVDSPPPPEAWLPLLEFGAPPQVVKNPLFADGFPFAQTNTFIESSGIFLHSDGTIDVLLFGPPYVNNSWECSRTPIGPFSFQITTSGDNFGGGFGSSSNILRFGEAGLSLMKTFAGLTGIANAEDPAAFSGIRGVLTVVQDNDTPPFKIGDVAVTPATFVSHAGEVCTLSGTDSHPKQDGNFRDFRYTAQLYLQAQITGFAFGKWNLIQIAADTTVPLYAPAPTYTLDLPNPDPFFNDWSTSATYPPNSAPKLYIALNNKDQTTSSIDWTSSCLNGPFINVPFPSTKHSVPKGWVLPQRWRPLFSNGFVWKGRVPGNGPTSAAYEDVVPPPSPVCAIGAVNNSSPPTTAPLSIGPWEINIEGMEFAVPHMSTTIDGRITSIDGGFYPTPPPPPPIATPVSQATIDYAAVQIWTDQTLNFSDSSVRSSFASGKKVLRPRVAQEAFGAAAYVLDGRPAAFVRNDKGTVGDLGQVGNFNPYPYPKNIL